MKKSVLYLMLCTTLGLGVVACSKNESAQTTQDNAPAETTAGEHSNETAEAHAEDANNVVMVKTVNGDKALEINPRPLAVYDMTVMQNLVALGIVADGLPTGLRLETLTVKDAPKATEIGTLREPNLEALSALNPKAVFIGSRMAAKSEEISTVAPVYDVTVDYRHAFESTKQQLTAFGALFDKTAEAEQAVSEIEAAIAEAKKAAEGKGNGLAILVNGDKLSVNGKDSRFGYLFNDFGIPIADDNIQDARHGQPVSFEYIKKIDPDWLFVVDRGAAIGEEGKSAQVVLDNPLMHNTKAWKNKHIVYLSGDTYLAYAGYYQWLADAKTVTEAFNNAK